VQYANARLRGLVFHRSHRYIDMACNTLEYISAALLDAPHQGAELPPRPREIGFRDLRRTVCGLPSFKPRVVFLEAGESGQFLDQQRRTDRHHARTHDVAALRLDDTLANHDQHGTALEYVGLGSDQQRLGVIHLGLRTTSERPYRSVVSRMPGSLRLRAGLLRHRIGERGDAGSRYQCVRRSWTACSRKATCRPHRPINPHSRPATRRGALSRRAPPRS
jgi:hypothetical protein